jgi:hypothetical protein
VENSLNRMDVMLAPTSQPVISMQLPVTPIAPHVSVSVDLEVAIAALPILQIQVETQTQIQVEIRVGHLLWDVLFP